MIAAASTRCCVKALPARGARALRARAPRVSRTSSRSSVTTRALAPEAMVSVGAATTGVQTLANIAETSTDMSGYIIPLGIIWVAIISLFLPIVTVSLNPIDIAKKLGLGE
ncbi:hypothetical protein NFJ02_05g120190 [Pycnococcus provasolii]